MKEINRTIQLSNDKQSMQNQAYNYLLISSIPYQSQRWLTIPILGSLSFIILAFCGYHIYDSHNFITVERAYLNSPRQVIKTVQAGKVAKPTALPNMYVKQGQVITYLTPQKLATEKSSPVAKKNNIQKIPIVAKTSGRVLPHSIPMEGLFLKSGDEVISMSSCKPMIDFLINQNQGKEIRRGSRVYFQIDNDIYKGRVELIQPYRLGMKINNLAYKEPLAHFRDLRKTSNMRGIAKLDAASEAQFYESVGACNVDVSPFAIKILK